MGHAHSRRIEAEPVVGDAGEPSIEKSMRSVKKAKPRAEKEKKPRAEKKKREPLTPERKAEIQQQAVRTAVISSAGMAAMGGGIAGACSGR